MYPAGALYREFEPCDALKRYVRAFFTFTAPPEESSVSRSITRQTVFREHELLCTPLCADGHVSIVFSFGPEYRVDGLWSPGPRGPRGHVIGAMSVARAATHGERIVQIGAYLRAAEARRFTSVPACELTDQIVAIDALWGRGSSLETRLGEAHGDAERVSLLEAALVQRIADERNSRGGAVDLAGIAACALARRGLLTVAQLADAAGVSRQHLTRLFREEVGVTPKLYCRLARFRAGLAYARANSDWADVAARLGYADQSHLIAEFREFSGLTPGRIAHERRFHPFMEQPLR